MHEVSADLHGYYNLLAKTRGESIYQDRQSMRAKHGLVQGVTWL